MKLAELVSKTTYITFYISLSSRTKFNNLVHQLSDIFCWVICHLLEFRVSNLQRVLNTLLFFSSFKMVQLFRTRFKVRLMTHDKDVDVCTYLNYASCVVCLLKTMEEITIMTNKPLDCMPSKKLATFRLAPTKSTKIFIKGQICMFHYCSCRVSFHSPPLNHYYTIYIILLVNYLEHYNTSPRFLLRVLVVYYTVYCTMHLLYQPIH